MFVDELLIPCANLIKVVGIYNLERICVLNLRIAQDASISVDCQPFKQNFETPILI